MEEGALHAAEFRRCLVQMDVDGMMKLWAHVAPHLANQSPNEALVSMHMARCEMKHISPRLKIYSQEWLFERGFRKIEDKWLSGPPPDEVIASAVGIAVRSKYETVRRRIHDAMSDALENERTKGTTDPLKQRDAMLAARARQRFRLRMA
ncbi:MAG: hypothetical protein NTZ54_09615 [Alphaproteobacteria bacterium]|nr:hypothetical protein [Alphaproteobacteria bacterium]